MRKKIGTTLGVLVLIAIGLVQCTSHDIFVYNKKTGESRTLMQAWVSQLLEAWVSQQEPVATVVPTATPATAEARIDNFVLQLTRLMSTLKLEVEQIEIEKDGKGGVGAFMVGLSVYSDFGSLDRLQPPSKDDYVEASKGRDFDAQRWYAGLLNHLAPCRQLGFQSMDIEGVTLGELLKTRDDCQAAIDIVVEGDPYLFICPDEPLCSPARFGR